MKYDKDFLKQLNNSRTKEVYVRIYALNFAEQPIEMIEGLATGGSINIDGASSLRRSCSLSLVAEELNINDFYWGIKNKFRLEIGLRNTIDLERYPEIVWFDQGIYLISTFNTSYTTNNYTVSISGKDKMALLNGETGGHLTSTVDFGVEEYHDLENNTTTFIDIPLKTIIQEMLHTWAGEEYHNIVINDLDIQGYELLEYRGDKPLFLTYSIKSGYFDNIYLYGENKCYFGDKETTFEDLLNNSSFVWNSMLEIDSEITSGNFSKITFEKNTTEEYTLAKVEYGQVAGYRLTDLTYAGELIGKAGETITSVLDKIVKMLGNYEYFYDTNGQFIFQKKQTYLQDVPNNIITDPEEGIYITPALNTSNIEYDFTNTELITSFSNNPTLSNLKNDFSVWGSKKSGSSSADIPIHYRYAYDRKPTKYISIAVSEEDIAEYNKLNVDIKMKAQESEPYVAEPEGKYNWRELIYQMAQDYYKYNRLSNFNQKIQEANPSFINGKTGYEQYYVDIAGFWRDVYDPSDPVYWSEYIDTSSSTTSFDSIEDLFLTSYYEAIDLNDAYNLDPSKVFVIADYEGGFSEIVPILDAFPTEFSASFKEDIDGVEYSNLYYIADGQNGYKAISEFEKPYVEKRELFIGDGEEKKSYYNYILDTKIKSQSSSSPGEDTKKIYIYKENQEPKKIVDSDDLVSYYREKISSNPDKYKYEKYLYQHYVDMDNELIKDANGNIIPPRQIPVIYKQECHDFNADTYWDKRILKEPTLLTYWLDFLDVNSELGQYAISQIGMRTKVVNDNNVKAIYYRAIPDIVFVNDAEVEVDSAYTKVQVQEDLESLFNISAQGKSAKDVIDELIYQHSYCVENVTIQVIPIYYLNPNTRIYISDEKSKINGEYIMTKFTIPLTYNGTMSITANKAPDRRLY